MDKPIKQLNTTWFECNHPVNIPIGYYSDGSIQLETDVIPFKTGDIFALIELRIGSFCILYKEEYFPILNHLDFFLLNDTIFIDITKNYIRDNQINKILNE